MNIGFPLLMQSFCENLSHPYSISLAIFFLHFLYEKFFFLPLTSDVDLGRHIVCEPCGRNVLGGFDFHRKQVQFFGFFLNCLFYLTFVKRMTGLRS